MFTIYFLISLFAFVSRPAALGGNCINTTTTNAMMNTTMMMNSTSTQDMSSIEDFITTLGLEDTDYIASEVTSPPNCMYPNCIRGKSLLESWVTTLLLD